jgi:hypothetical protein
MDAYQPVELLSDAEVLAKFGTAEAPERRGFDEATQTRVFAYELVRARQRLAHYRTLYTSFVREGKPYMIENLDETLDDGGIPAKLVFSDDAEQALALSDDPDVIVWVEPLLLEALTRERAVLDFFNDLLDELEPAVLSE